MDRQKLRRSWTNGQFLSSEAVRLIRRHLAIGQAVCKILESKHVIFSCFESLAPAGRILSAFVPAAAPSMPLVDARYEELLQLIPDFCIAIDVEDDLMTNKLPRINRSSAGRQLETDVEAIRRIKAMNKPGDCAWPCVMSHQVLSILL